MINLKEFLTAVCEKDTTGISLTAIVADCDTVNVKTGEEKQIISVTLQKPVISVERHGNYIQLDFTFISALDNDLKMFWTALELYGKTVSDVNPIAEQTGTVATGSITLVPTQFNGKYFAVAVNPIFWSLTCSEVGEAANVIRVLVEADSFEVYENKEIDMAAIKKEVDAEIAYENRMKAHMQQSAQSQNNKI